MCLSPGRSHLQFQCVVRRLETRARRRRRLRRKRVLHHRTLALSATSAPSFASSTAVESPQGRIYSTATAASRSTVPFAAACALSPATVRPWCSRGPLQSPHVAEPEREQGLVALALRVRRQQHCKRARRLVSLPRRLSRLALRLRRRRLGRRERRRLALPKAADRAPRVLTAILAVVTPAAVRLAARVRQPPPARAPRRWRLRKLVPRLKLRLQGAHHAPQTVHLGVHTRHEGLRLGQLRVLVRHRRFG